MPPDDIATILTQLARAIRRQFGVSPVRVKIFTREKETFKLPIPFHIEMACAPSAPAAPEEVVNDRQQSACINDILKTLEKAGRPLTTTRLMAEMAHAGKEWSLSHVSHFLAAMVLDGTLENPKGVKPLGYRLPEWEQRQTAE